MYIVPSFQPTIIQQINDYHGNQIYIKREDLLPVSFGGNKVRIAQEYLNDMISRGFDTLVGYGNTRSNLCRVLSNLAFKAHIPCYIVSPADDNGEIVDTNNKFLSTCCDAHYIHCQKSNVSSTISELLNSLKEQNKKPYYINGNEFGEGNEATPINAYFNVFKEICVQEEALKTNFDYIFLAVGTGMTYSGLTSAKIIEKDSSHNIIGISIARTKKQCINKIENYLYSFLKTKGVSIEKEELNKYINVTDDFLAGGYSIFNDDIKVTISQLYKEDGIYADPTYVGKAFYGMKKYIEIKDIKRKNILFIHTGSTPLFFDKIKEIFGD